jgi:phage terminase large subunit GpA-like protein
MRPRNEALDCRVYALSAFTILNADLNRISEKQKGQAEVNPKVNPNRLKHYKKHSNFAKSWND